MSNYVYVVMLDGEEVGRFGMLSSAMIFAEALMRRYFDEMKTIVSIKKEEVTHG